MLRFLCVAWIFLSSSGECIEGLLGDKRHLCGFVYDFNVICLSCERDTREQASVIMMGPVIGIVTSCLALLLFFFTSDCRKHGQRVVSKK